MPQSRSVEEEKGRKSESVVEEDKDETEIDEVERQSEGSGGIHEDLIDAVARGTEDAEVLREQDRFLPICNIARVMRRMVPESGKMSKESKEAVQEAVSEFISFITSEASDKCIEEQRKTITCDDLLNAFQLMGFDKYVEPLKLFLKRYREATRNDRPNGEGRDGRSPSPSPSSIPILTPSSSIPIPIPSSSSIPIPTPSSSSIPLPTPSTLSHVASGPGGPIQPTPSSSLPSLSSTSILNTGNGPLRLALPPGFVLGEKGDIMYKGPSKTMNGQQTGSSIGEGEGNERRINGNSHGYPTILPKHSQGASTSSTERPVTIFVDQNSGQRYRSIIGHDGTQRLAPIRMIRRQGPPHPHPPPPPPPSSSSSLRRIIDTPQSIPDHQSPQISSTTTTSQLHSQSQYHSHSNHSSFPIPSHSHHSSNPSSQYHQDQHNPVSYHPSSSSNHHTSMPPPSLPPPPPPPPPPSSSTNYIQLMPHSSVPSTYTQSTTTHLQYTQYQDQLMRNVEEGMNGGTDDKRQITSSIANMKWNPSSGQYVVDSPKISGDIITKRRRINNRGQ